MIYNGWSLRRTNIIIFIRAVYKDRHACIGLGNTGYEALHAITRHQKLTDLSFVLETPNDLTGYANEIAILKED